MGGFFQVGERYANRIGEYEVIEMRTPVLVIRYVETGRVQEVEEELQERIVRNLHREIELANRPPEARKPASRSTRSRRKRAKFEGFRPTDFQGRITGTSWRAKTGLGGVVAQLLSGAAGETFESWAPNRQTACYIARPEECGATFLGDSAQFFVLASLEGLSYGLQVQRPADTDKATAWDRLISALSDDETAASALYDLLLAEDVELRWYAEAKGAAGGETVRGQEEGLFMDRGAVTETDTIEALLERLQSAPDDENLTLSIEAGMSTQDAIAIGADIGAKVVELLEKLLPLYRACSG